MNRTRLKTLLLVPVAAASLSACGVNSIPTADEEVKAKWADVQADYQRRANLIPNLVATVKGAAQFERGTLTDITNARASATKITLTPDQLSDPEAMRRFSEAQGRLSAAIIPLQRLQESYPDLKANQNFNDLQQQLEGTENRIAIAIRDYNGAVQSYNTQIRTFPAIIGAKLIYGAKPRVPYEATTPNAEQAPPVSFDTK